MSVDPSRVRQAIEDLLDNAFDHGANGPIEVSARATDGLVWIGVRDHGAGFPRAMLTRRPEPFARSGALQEGAGLGLAIVTAVAEAHGGSIELRNAEGGGARVTFSLRVPSNGQALGDPSVPRVSAR